MSGRFVEFASDGGQTRGYLSVPPRGEGPGVVVIHEWWGLNDQIEGMADRLARAGFTALVPDLYHGKLTQEPDEAGKLMMALDVDQVARDLTGAVRYLLAQSGTTGQKAGVIGFCMGGQLSLYAAAVAPDLFGAVVDMYGIHPSVKPEFAHLKAPVLGLFGEKDASVPPEAVHRLEETLKRAGVSAEIHIYPEVGHAFLNERRLDGYDVPVAEDAWGRILTFFKQHLS